jgi:hypothetical protein
MINTNIVKALAIISLAKISFHQHGDSRLCSNTCLRIVGRMESALDTPE